jgi:hypothetical protein
LDNINGKASLIFKEIWVFPNLAGNFPFIFIYSEINISDITEPNLNQILDKISSNDLYYLIVLDIYERGFVYGLQSIGK